MQQENLKTQGFGTFGLKTGEEKPALAFLVSEFNFIRSYYHLEECNIKGRTWRQLNQLKF